MKAVKLLDDYLGRISMYKLLFYYLIALITIATCLSQFKIMHYPASGILGSTLILLIACWAANKFFALVFRAPINNESVYITAMILALIIAPLTSRENVPFLLAASGLAMASKYILTINKKHIFNPAAIAVVLTAIGPRQSADWWIGTSAMLPFVLIGGVLLIRKIGRGKMVASFFISALAATTFYTLLLGGGVGQQLDKTIMSSAMFFLGFVMLSEPLTTPPTKQKQTWYAVIVGIIFPPQFHVFSLYSTPELALVAGNVFSYIVGSKTKLFPRLVKINKTSNDCLDLIFAPEKALNYQPGQYMEWTLAHNKTDFRGNRRYFTLASSPSEDTIRIGVKFKGNVSSYKRALMRITPKTPIIASQLAGDFTMPTDIHKKLVFIAGGIGITPFRSMIKYLIDTNEQREITLLYAVKSENDLIYKDVFNEAKIKINLKAVYILSDQSSKSNDSDIRYGRITEQLIKTEILELSDKTFYISGTHKMVEDINEDLKSLGVLKRQIKIDYFPGY